MSAMKQQIRVLIVDDSALVRQTLADVLRSDPDIEVIGTASDPFVAARRIQDEVPDVITLDVEMPRMDGITFLRKLMAQRPIPVVMCSSLTEDGSETLMQALEAGAVDVILKPRVGTAQFLQESRVRICDAVKAAAQARLHRAGRPRPCQRRAGSQAHRRRDDAAAGRRPRHGAHHRTGGLHRRLHRRHRIAARRAGGAAGRPAPASSSCSTCRRSSPRPSPAGSTGCASWR